MRTDFISHRSAPLDVLRAGAVTAVVIYHVAATYGRAAVPSLDPVAQWFARHGFLGVDIFFPLSGFLIVRFLLGWQGSHLGRVFFLRRFFRIVPLYMVATVIYVAVSLATGRNLDVLGNIWIVFAFLTGWMMFFLGRDVVPYTITWSISVEEFGYILLGLTAMVSRFGLRALLFALLVLPLVLRLYLDVEGFPRNLIYYLPPARLDSIAIGGIVALYIHRPGRLLAGLLAAFVAVTAIEQTGDLARRTMLNQDVACLAAIAIVLVEIWRRPLEGRVTTAVARVGFYSYFIYLFHYFTITAVYLVLSHLTRDPLPFFWPVVALSLALTHGMAWLSFRYFEGPILAWGRRLEPQRPAPQRADIRAAAPPA